MLILYVEDKSSNKSLSSQIFHKKNTFYNIIEELDQYIRNVMNFFTCVCLVGAYLLNFLDIGLFIWILCLSLQ